MKAGISGTRRYISDCEETAVVDHEAAVRRDPEVLQARRIAEAARARLLECLNADDADAMAEAQQMLDALRKATVLAAAAEDRARVRLGLLTQAEADRRARDRGVSFEPWTPQATTTVRPRASRFAFLTKPALAAVLALLAAAAAWLAARARRARRAHHTS
jgi:hypothetical protein